MKIIEITENKKQYLDLPLPADEQEDMIDRLRRKMNINMERIATAGRVTVVKTADIH